jgi:hypothetical protein
MRKRKKQRRPAVAALASWGRKEETLTHDHYIDAGHNICVGQSGMRFSFTEK